MVRGDVGEFHSVATDTPTRTCVGAGGSVPAPVAGVTRQVTARAEAIVATARVRAPLVMTETLGRGSQCAAPHTVRAFRARGRGHGRAVRSARVDPVPEPELTVSKPTTSSPQNTLADVEQRIVAAAREREQAGGDMASQPHTDQS